MSQQINLLNPALIRPRDWLSLRNVLVMYAAALALMLWYYSSMQSEAEALNMQRTAAVTQFEGVQKSLVEASNDKSHMHTMQALEQELQHLMQQKNAQGKLLDTFKHVQGDGGHHLLDYMTGFARQSMTGVWITDFKVNAFEQNMSLTGRALQAERVPVYLEQLGQQAVFKGQLFSGLTLKAMSQKDEHAQGEEAALPAAEPPSSTKPAGEGAPVIQKMASPAKTERLPVTVIEFEVKGMQTAEEPAKEVSPLSRQESGRG